MKKLVDVDERSWLTVREAADLAECTTRHIQNLITEGKMSSGRAENGNYQIDKAEFFRVFPGAYDKEQKRIENERIKDVARTLLLTEIEHLKTLMSEKDKLNEFLKQQLELQANEKGKLIDTLSSNQRLLEHQSEKATKKRWWGKS